MPWVQIARAEEVSWAEYEQVSTLLGEKPWAGLIVHAAGEVDGRWQAVSVWESREAAEAFRDERLLPAVAAALGEELVADGPPPEEWFEVKHMLTSTVAG